MPFGLAESCVFAKQSPGPLYCAPGRPGGPFSRSYGSNLPSSLATDHSSALGYSPRLPVSVCGTGCLNLKFRGFSWKPAWGHYHLRPGASVYYRVSAQRADLPAPLNAYALQRPIPSGRSPYAPSSPHHSQDRCRNVDRLAIGIASRLILRTRLTLFRLPLNKETLVLRRAGFSPALSLLMPTSAFVTAPAKLTLYLLCRYNAPLPFFRTHGFGGGLDARLFSAQGRSTSELLRTL